MKELRVFEEAIDAWRALEERWRMIAAAAIEERGLFTVALSGGNTPVGFYCYLSRREGLPWGDTEIFQVDERYVARESEESNFFMIESALLSGSGVAPRGVHSVETDTAGVVASAERYEREMKLFFGAGEKGWPVFDLVLLGIGEDGHTASLFPGGAELDEDKRWVTVARPSTARLDRITVTLPVLQHCRHAVFLATGTRKAAVVRGVWEGKGNVALPASLVRARDSLTIFVDKAAGSCV